MCLWGSCTEEIKEGRQKATMKKYGKPCKFCLTHSLQNSENYECQKNGEEAKFPPQKKHMNHSTFYFPPPIL